MRCKGGGGKIVQSIFGQRPPVQTGGLKIRPTGTRMNTMSLDPLQLTRRSFLGGSALGLGSAALSWLSAPKLLGAAPRAGRGAHGGLKGFPHFAPKAKRVIFLYMSGGPSHLETFDYKPKLADLDGQPMPESYTKGQPIAQLQGQELRCLAPQFKFQKHGKSGQEIAD